MGTMLVVANHNKFKAVVGRMLELTGHECTLTSHCVAGRAGPECLFKPGRILEGSFRRAAWPE